jgi:hypothetical protein
MQPHPQLVQHLERTAPDCLKSLLIWFNIDTHSLQSQSERLDALLSEMNTMSVETCYQSLSQLELPDLVRLSILNEFGPEFADKPSFSLLETTTSHRLLKPAF